VVHRYFKFSIITKHSAAVFTLRIPNFVQIMHLTENSQRLGCDAKPLHAA